MNEPPKKMRLKSGNSMLSLERNSQERNPNKVLDESTQETTMSEPVLQEGERNIAKDREYSHTSEPGFETAEIPAVKFNGESEQEIVEQGEGCASSDTVCEDCQ